MATILITGGSGLIGKALQEELSSRGHSIKLLTTGKNNKSKSKMAFDWDIKNFTIDEKAFEDVDIIIHLAGANIAENVGQQPINKKFYSRECSVWLYYRRLLKTMQKNQKDLFLCLQVDIMRTLP